MTGQALIELTGVGKNYPLTCLSSDRLAALWDLLRGRPIRRTRNILHDIDLRVLPGCSVGIIGENGAGKSTLLKLITGVLQASHGIVKTRGRIGALLELGAGFHPDYTGRENISLNATLVGLTPAEILAKTPEIIAFADIGDYIDEPIKHYSSGMVVRLGFAIIAATAPDLLITDEVLAVGDESFKKKCVKWLENYVAGGGTLLIVSHSMYHIQKLCQQAIWLKEGAIQKSGDVFEVTQAYLAFHERKTAKVTVTERAAANGDRCRIDSLSINGSAAAQSSSPMGTDLHLQGVVYSPDERTPVVVIGIVRVDGTPVYGTSSEIDSARLGEIDPHHYSFEMVLEQIPLLPGAYTVRSHAMDPEGVRLFDTLSLDFIVSGESRELGFCRLPHRWVDSSTAPADAHLPDSTDS
ncbi:MAG: ABC transporter ATP-binding protein [Gammaproteobacteria bacterium]|nr:MAG: ABC transporter ATP-binding protein [Gammaproteobacteria bacterium]